MMDDRIFRIWLLTGVVAIGCGDDGAAGMPDAAGADAAADAAIDARDLTGKVVHHVTVGGLERELIVYLPPSAATAADLPVVFMIHGTSQDGEELFGKSQWKEKADAEQLIAVFPTALIHCYAEDENGDGDTVDPGEARAVEKWMSGQFPPCTAMQLANLPPDKRAAADHPPADDVAFFDAMIEVLATSYAIDRKRVYATGFSNGGAMSGRLVLERSTVFAAATSSGGFLGLPGTATRPMSVIATVGELDQHYTTSALPLRESLLTEMPALKARAVTPYLDALSLADSYVYDERTIGGRKVIRFTYATSTAGAKNNLQFIVFEGMGHVYANGTNDPLVFADPFWAMFETQSLP